MIKNFLHPFNIFWFLFLIGIAALLLKKEKIYFAVFILAAFWFFITSNYLLPKVLISRLENEYTPFVPPQELSQNIPCNIVILGAGFTNNKKLPFNDQLAPSALARLIEGIRIHKLIPASKLVVSGPGYHGQISQAEVYKKAAVSLGVDSSAISIINTATDTYEESKKYTENFGTNIPVILVTSASHMPRAMMMFEHQGIKPIPAPTDYHFKSDTFGGSSWLPSLQNMDQMKIAITELVGTLYAKWYLFKN